MSYRCLICGKELEAHIGRGQPQRYCGRCQGTPQYRHNRTRREAIRRLGYSNVTEFVDAVLINAQAVKAIKGE